MLSSVGIRMYERRRREGWDPQFSLHAAKVEEQWLAQEREWRVRLAFEPDEDTDLDMLIGDRDPTMTDRQWEADRKAVRSTAEREGVWGALSQVFNEQTDDWETVESIWGFLGQDCHMYEPDLKKAALAELDARNAAKALELEARATYAAGGDHAQP